MIKIFKDLLTGKDGITHDLGRWSWVVSMFAVVGAATWNKVSGSAINLVDFATAIAAVVGAHGVAIFAKKDTEPS